MRSLRFQPIVLPKTPKYLNQFFQMNAPNTILVTGITQFNWKTVSLRIQTNQLYMLLHMLLDLQLKYSLQHQ